VNARTRAAIAGALLAVGALSACGTVHHLAAKISCAAKLHTWEHQGGGQAKTIAVGHALTAVGKADTALSGAHFDAASLRTVTSTTATMLAAVQALNADRPPACVPHLAADLHATLAKLTAGGQEENMAVAAAKAKNFAAVSADLRLAGADFEAGGRDFTKTGHDITRYAKS